jgi:hypothetical protein
MTNPDPDPACVAHGCPCQCHDGEGDDCDFQGCSFWPLGAPPDPDEEPEYAAPPLEKP